MSSRDRQVWRECAEWITKLWFSTNQGQEVVDRAVSEARSRYDDSPAHVPFVRQLDASEVEECWEIAWQEAKGFDHRRAFARRCVKLATKLPEGAVVQRTRYKSGSQNAAMSKAPNRDGEYIYCYIPDAPPAKRIRLGKGAQEVETTLTRADLEQALKDFDAP